MNNIEKLDGWSVSIEANGENILTISNQHLSGITNINDYKELVIHCANHLCAFIGAEDAKALQSSEPVASVIYEVYVGLDNWREVPKAEYDDYKRTKRTLVTANTTDFCYAELKDIYDEMYQHKDIARVANRLYKLIHSRTHPPASAPLEKYNKLLDAAKSARRALASASNDNANYTIAYSEIDQAIAEAEGKEG